ncbi:hypothetical protein lpari_03151 [Legionella parisiensis]|uniref:Uncharacterized protein n=1 Tax=Legionella parisiensis TaxID=45071 RepID=A0A1E5JMU4_9GAMM|nr:hypothetical protein lpari_03151 [Legionella parisiensis]STX72348.1 Uncharacterised protein [Legionella parisiensis]
MTGRYDLTEILQFMGLSQADKPSIQHVKVDVSCS